MHDPLNYSPSNDRLLNRGFLNSAARRGLLLALCAALSLAGRAAFASEENGFKPIFKIGRAHV